MTVSDDHNQMLSKLFNPEFMKSDLHKRKLPPSFFKQPSEDRRASINPEGLKIQTEVSIFHNKSNSSPACINPEFYDKANLLRPDSLEKEFKPSIPQPTPVHVKSESYDVSDQRLLSGALKKNRFEICPLGPSYDMDLNSAGQVYFLNHESQATTWFDPRIPVEYQRWGMSLQDLEDAHKAYANVLQSKSCDDVMKTPSSMKPIQQLQFHGRSFSQPASSSSAQTRAQSCTLQSHLQSSQIPSGHNVTVPTCSSHAFSAMEPNTATTALLSSPGTGIPSPAGCFTSAPAVSSYKLPLPQHQRLVVFENNSTRSHPPIVYTRSNTVPGIIANTSHNQLSAVKHKESHSHYHHPHHLHHPHPHHFHHQSAPVPSPSSTRGIGQRGRVMPIGGYPTSPTNLSTVPPHSSQKPQHTMSLSSSSTSSMNQNLPPLPSASLGGGGIPYSGYPVNIVSPPSHSHQSSLDSGRGSGKCSSHYGAPEFQSFQSMNKSGPVTPSGNNNLVSLTKIGTSGAPMPKLNVCKTSSQPAPLSPISLTSGLNVLTTGAADVVMVEQQYAFTDGSLMNSSNLETVMPMEPMDYSISMDDLPDISDLDFDLNIGSPNGPMHVQ